MQRKDSVKWRKNVDKKEAIKELKFERNISAGVMEQLGTTKALREIVAIQQKKRTNNTIISIHVGSWDSGTAIISYTQGRPSLSIK